MSRGLAKKLREPAIEQYAYEASGAFYIILPIIKQTNNKALARAAKQGRILIYTRKVEQE